MKSINLEDLPFNAEGKASSCLDVEPEPKRENPFWGFNGTAGRLKTKPILVHYQNYYTVFEFGRIEVPRQPCIAAFNADRPLVIYFVTDKGLVMATRLEKDEITEAVVAKRTMPHFPKCPEHIRRKNPEGFTMLVLKLPIEMWVEIEQLEPESHREAIAVHKR